jgi:hypothetical protein
MWTLSYRRAPEFLLPATLAAALAAVVVIGLPTAAYATSQGSPGKVVYIEGASNSIKVWDPGTEESTALVTDIMCPFRGLDAPPGICVGPSNGIGGNPSWSPDGTKIAFSMWLPDAPDPAGLARDHSAIFVMNADGTDRTQVTFPPAAVDSASAVAAAAGDPDWEDYPTDGYSFSDFSPTWSPNGSTIAFIRDGNIGPENTSQTSGWGGQVWRVPATGGGATQVTQLVVNRAQVQAENGENPPGYRSVVWSPTAPQLLAYRTDVNHFDKGLDLISASDGGASTLVDGWIRDYDWAPDGHSLAYLTETGDGPIHLRQLSGATTDVGSGRAMVRYSPDGNGPVSVGCVGISCAFYNYLPADPDSNLRADETQKKLDYPLSVLNSDADYGRTPWDIQSQDLPVVFLPGFLGSEIEGCSGETLWPPSAWPPTNGAHLEDMRLDGTGCPDAHPTGAALGSVLGKDIYDGVQSWLDSKTPGGDQVSHVVYGWDWRKSPDAAMVGLNTAINDALDQDLPKRQGADRVVFLAHSYGGLLGKWYMAQSQDNADKVARVLTMGTPWWGSPKVLMPLAFGIESPLNEPGMDLVLPNDDLQAFARSLAGLFELFPSAHFGPWLVAAGQVQDSAGVRATVQALGGDPSLYDAAQQHHDSTYDGYFDNDGKTDVQAVVGAGLPTFGSVILNSASTLVGWVNGDGTVPLLSAQQGSDPNNPLGDPVHIQSVCGVSHVDLANSSKVLDAYQDFLLYGRTPRKTEGNCPDVGGQLEIFDMHVDLPRDSAARALYRHARKATGLDDGALSLAEAFQQSKIDLLDLRDRTTVVTSATNPVALRFAGEGTTFTYTPISGSTSGTPLEYGPVTGDVVISANGGGTPVVTVDGVAVTPHVATSTGTGGQSSNTTATQHSAQLAVSPSAIRHHRLRLGLTFSQAAIGSTVTVSAKGLHMTAPITTTHLNISRRLTGKLAKVKTLKVDLKVAPSATTWAASTSLLAAAHPPRLKVRKQSFGIDGLVLSGAIAKSAKRRVLVDATWTRVDGSLGAWHGSARIHKGRWRLQAALPAEAHSGGELTVSYPGDAKHALAGARLVRAL